jgi:hypothetical protein
MRFKYSTTSPTQNEFDSLPRVPLSLSRADQRIEAVGLVDSGANFNAYTDGVQRIDIKLRGCLIKYKYSLFFSAKGKMWDWKPSFFRTKILLKVGFLEFSNSL